MLLIPFCVKQRTKRRMFGFFFLLECLACQVNCLTYWLHNTINEPPINICCFHPGPHLSGHHGENELTRKHYVSEFFRQPKGLWPSSFLKPGNSITFYVSFCQSRSLHHSCFDCRIFCLKIMIFLPIASKPHFS